MAKRKKTKNLLYELKLEIQDLDHTLTKMHEQRAEHRKQTKRLGQEIPPIAAKKEEKIQLLLKGINGEN